MVSNPEKQRISAFVICFNEARNIRRCLESLRWCDEILVIDSGSTDGTVDIAREFTSQVIHNDWAGYVGQKQFGLGRCTGDWVINIDSDEEISPELREEILETVRKNDPRYDGYDILRVVFYLGKWWRKGGWYPEYRLRLLRRTKAVWAGFDPHERAEVEGQTARLKSELRHYTYTSITEQIKALNSHSSVAAKSLYELGKTTSLVEMIVRPPARFIKFYLLKKGFLEGFSGFIVGVLESYYVFLKYIKLWELTRDKTAGK